MTGVALLALSAAVVLTWPELWRQASARVSAVHGAGENGHYLMRVTWPDGERGTGRLRAAWQLGAGISLLVLDSANRAVPRVVALVPDRAGASTYRAVQRAIGSIRAE